MPSKMTNIDHVMKGLFTDKPDESPQWAKDVRAARAEIERTGNRVMVPPHDDNCGAPCREVGPASLVYDLRHHDCCSFCNDLGEKSPDGEHPNIGAMAMERATR